MGDDVYSRLRELLDSLPGGFPATDSGIEMKILQKLFSPEDAEMAVCLGPEPAPVKAIALQCGLNEQETAERLDSMASRGLIRREDIDGQACYRAEQFLVGIYEWQGNRMDREFAELFEQYLPWFGMAMSQIKTQQMRIIPVLSAIDTNSAVATYDDVRALVNKHDSFAVTECVCRVQQGLLGNRCDKPLEVCMGLGPMVDYGIEHGWPGRKISREEALETLARSEELGLVLRPDNAQNINFVCSCCSCCCPSLRFMKMAPNTADFLHSNYRSFVDKDKCSACGTCLERCPMDAVIEGEEFMEINTARCIGCGVCLSACPEEALSLVPREDAEVPPADWDETLQRIATERGLPA